MLSGIRTHGELGNRKVENEGILRVLTRFYCRNMKLLAILSQYFWKVFEILLDFWSKLSLFVRICLFPTYPSFILSPLSQYSSSIVRSLIKKKLLFYVQTSTFSTNFHKKPWIPRNSSSIKIKNSVFFPSNINQKSNSCCRTSCKVKKVLIFNSFIVISSSEKLLLITVRRTEREDHAGVRVSLISNFFYIWHYV